MASNGKGQDRPPDSRQTVWNCSTQLDTLRSCLPGPHRYCEAQPCPAPKAILEARAAMTDMVVHLSEAVSEVKPKPARCRTPAKLRRPPTRKELLAMLRSESIRRENSAYQINDGGLLIDLAYAAANSTKRSITWRGIRFPLRVGIWLTVLDPETLKPLVSTQGGVVL